MFISEGNKNKLVAILIEEIMANSASKDTQMDGERQPSEAKQILQQIKGQQILLPNLEKLLAPWEYQKATKDDIAELAVNQYLDNYVTNTITRKKYAAAQFEELVQHVFPSCPTDEKLALGAAYITWIFHWDDELDCGSLTDDENAANQYVTDTVERLQGLHYGRSLQENRHANETNPAISALDQFDLSFQGGFRPREVRLYLESVKTVEVKMKMIKAQRSGMLLSLAEYTEFRIPDSVIPMAIYFAECLLDLELPQWIFALPEIQAIIREAAIMGFIANDLLSLPKDVRTEPNNQSIVPVLVKEHHCTAQAAVEIAIQMMLDSHATFCATEEVIGRMFGEHSVYHQGVNAFIQAAKDLCIGVIHWSWMTPRYMAGGSKQADGGVMFVLGD